MACSTGRWQILPYWRTLVVLLAPLLLLPMPLVSATSESRCGYVILLMALFWMTEALPLAVTALMPVIFFPMLGIMDTGDLCLLYMKETNMMFLGGLAVALAVEHCNLHKRIALFVLLNIGQSPRRLMAGFMLTTMFLSMWISNTASTAMMVPIVDAIMVELFSKSKEADLEREEQEKGEEIQEITSIEINKRDIYNVKGTIADQSGVDTLAVTVKSGQSASGSLQGTLKSGQSAAGSLQGANQGQSGPTPVRRPAVDANVVVKETDNLTDVGREMRKALMLSVAYSANIGGTGVVTGTTPNLILMSTLKESYSDPTGLTFASWMGYNIPGMLLCVFLAWIWLQVMFMGFRGGALSSDTAEQRLAVKRLMQKRYRSLGSISFHETVVLTLFVVLVFLWLFRSPEFVKGWSYWFVLAFGDVVVDDATPVMLIVMLLFIIPKKLNFWCFRNPNDPSPVETSEACLTWKVLHEKIPWGVVLLLGGGFAMADAADVSGLSTWLGSQMEALSALPNAAIVFIVSLMTAMVTEVASNTATASILMPVLNELSIGISVNPLYLMLPAAVCCSYAFMLPVATPPNAIVFAASDLKTVDMMKAGFVMNIVCVFSVTLMINTLGVAMFDLRNFPDWANSTISASY